MDASEAWDRARRMKKGRRTFSEISIATGLPVHEVARELCVKVRARGIPWTKAQIDHLKANARRPEKELAKEIAKLGPARTPQAVGHKKAELGLTTKRPKLAASWPVLRGTEEERDAKFVRMVQAEALRVFHGRAA